MPMFAGVGRYWPVGSIAVCALDREVQERTLYELPTREFKLVNALLNPVKGKPLALRAYR